MRYIIVSVHGLKEIVDYELPNHLTFLQCYDIIKKDMLLRENSSKVKVKNSKKVFAITQTLNDSNITEGDALEFI